MSQKVFQYGDNSNHLNEMPRKYIRKNLVSFNMALSQLK